MKIDDHTVDHLANLAKLEFEKEAREEIIKDLNRILSFIDKLKELDTTDVEPLIYMNDEVNVLREDEVKQEISQKEALSNAPKKDSDYFKVPKVLDKTTNSLESSE
jgi:aspartyl-tRNA(Asn)/glutamyl-tRNA(Gln) amidotransferase subunit C